MRPDMDKVIVERPRTGAGECYSSARHLDRQKDFDDLPSKQSMRRPYNDRKQLNENLAPLTRWLRKNVGRHWNEVYSEAATLFSGGSTVQVHVKNHLKQMVYTDTESVHGLIIVKPPYMDSRSVETLTWQTFYVHPVSFLLCEHNPKKEITWQTKRKAEQEARMRVLGTLQQAHKVNGCWFLLELRQIPKLRDSIYGQSRTWFRDNYLGKFFSEDAHRTYGDSNLYCHSKRQLSSKEIKNLKLNEPVS